MDFAQRLNQLMNAKGVTSYRVGKDTGVSNRLVDYWKKGEKKPGAENLKKLADYFHVSTDYLLGNTPYPTFSDAFEATKDLPPVEQIEKLQSWHPDTVMQLPDTPPGFPSYNLFEQSFIYYLRCLNREARAKMQSYLEDLLHVPGYLAFDPDTGEPLEKPHNESHAAQTEPLPEDWQRYVGIKIAARGGMVETDEEAAKALAKVMGNLLLPEQEAQNKKKEGE